MVQKKMNETQSKNFVSVVLLSFPSKAQYDLWHEKYITFYNSKAVEDLKKSNTKVMKSVEVINMLTSRLKMEKYFTKKECEDVQNYIYLAMNNF